MARHRGGRHFPPPTPTTTGNHAHSHDPGRSGLGMDRDSDSFHNFNRRLIQSAEGARSSAGTCASRCGTVDRDHRGNAIPRGDPATFVCCCIPDSGKARRLAGERASGLGGWSWGRAVIRVTSRSRLVVVAVGFPRSSRSPADEGMIYVAVGRPDSGLHKRTAIFVRTSGGRWRSFGARHREGIWARIPARAIPGALKNLESCPKNPWADIPGRTDRTTRAIAQRLREAQGKNLFARALGARETSAAGDGRVSPRRYRGLGSRRLSAQAPDDASDPAGPLSRSQMKALGCHSLQPPLIARGNSLPATKRSGGPEWESAADVRYFRDSYCSHSKME